MLFATCVAALRDHLDKRRRYHRLVAEIMDLSDEEIADMKSQRDEMLRYAHWRVYGARTLAGRKS